MTFDESTSHALDAAFSAIFAARREIVSAVSFTDSTRRWTFEIASSTCINAIIAGFIPQRFCISSETAFSSASRSAAVPLPIVKVAI